MQTTGYQLREAIKRWQLRRDTAAAQFADSLSAFPGDDKPEPHEVMRRFVEAEGHIAELQAHQARYNLSVHVVAPGLDHMPLHQAVKLVGGMGRRERMWRNVAAPPKSPYGSRITGERDKDVVVAKAVVSQMDAMRLAHEAGAFASTLRTAIAVANAAQRDLEGLSSALFE